MNQRVRQPFLPRAGIALALGSLGACAGPTDFSVPVASTPIELWHVPDRPRRVAEALLPQGEWLTIAHERHGSRDCWRFRREVQVLDVREVLLDDDGGVLYRKP